MLIGPKKLSEKLGNPNLIVVDCPWEYYSYTRAHIPGARCRPGHSYIKSKEPGGEDSLFVVEDYELCDLLKQLGIEEGSTVVLYDEWGSIFATRLWWVLKYYGFNNAYVLDGGWQNWVEMGYPISYRTNEYNPSEHEFGAQADVDRIVSREQLTEAMEDPRWQIIDARSHGEYTGADQHGNMRAGHIPGALHVEWNTLLENSTDTEGVRRFRPPEEIKAIFDNAGVNPEKRTVAHCQSAVRATMIAFVFEMLGYPPVGIYDGSMAEWANRDDTALVMDV